MDISETCTPEDAAAQLFATHDDEWMTALASELNRRLSGARLERIMRLWDLSRADLGQLFGVSRQAVSKWIAGGVPADRAHRVADVDAMTDVLDRYLKPTRIPAVVRRRATGLGGASLIELIAAGNSRGALEATRQMFAFTDLHA